MEWKDYAKEIKAVLGLSGSPVAITYSMEPPTAAIAGKHRVCEAFLKARDGEIVDLTAKSSSCRGGSWHLGLAERPRGEGDKALKDFLVKGEKLFCSVAVFYRAQYLCSAPPLGLAEHVVLSPMEKAEFEPDVVLFVCNPLQACRLVTLDTYATGVPPKLEMCGSTCHQAVAYPVVTGELNVSLMDYTSRRLQGYKDQDLLVSTPYHRFLSIMRNLDRCTAGRARFEVPESLRRLVGREQSREI